MIAAYVDASEVVGILLGEPEAALLRELLARHTPLLAADLLTAEVYVVGNARDQLAFVTRDASQRAVAHRPGFATP